MFRIAFLSHIGLHADGLMAFLLEFLGRGLRVVQVGNHNACALFGQVLTHGKANAHCPPGDQRNFVL